MKKKRACGTAVACAVAAMIGVWFAGCPTGIGGEEEPAEDSAVEVDPAFWFGEIYAEMLERKEKGTMGVFVTRQYVVDRINEKWGKDTLTLPLGEQATFATAKFFLDSIDKANKGRTNHGSSKTATSAFIDDESVLAAIKKYWVPAAGWVAVGNEGKMAHSTDGITWNEITVGKGYWAEIAFGNGRWVAVGFEGTMAYSTDGITWTEITVGKENWLGVAFGNNYWVAVGNNGAMAHSTDGITWTEITVGTKHWYGVAIAPK